MSTSAGDTAAAAATSSITSAATEPSLALDDDNGSMIATAKESVLKASESLLKGHTREVLCVASHPVEAHMIASGR